MNVPWNVNVSFRVQVVEVGEKEEKVCLLPLFLSPPPSLLSHRGQVSRWRCRAYDITLLACCCFCYLIGRRGINVFWNGYVSFLDQIVEGEREGDGCPFLLFFLLLLSSFSSPSSDEEEKGEGSSTQPFTSER